MFQKINKMLDSHFDAANIPPSLKTLSAADWNLAACFNEKGLRLETELSRPTRTDGSVTRDKNGFNNLCGCGAVSWSPTFLARRFDPNVSAT